MFLTRCPRVIPVLWTIINTFVEERTREKFAILKTDELIEYIDEINIPDFLGGQMPVGVSLCCSLTVRSSVIVCLSSFKLPRVASYRVPSIYAKTSRTNSMRRAPCSVIMLTQSFQSKKAVPTRLLLLEWQTESWRFYSRSWFLFHRKVKDSGMISTCSNLNAHSLFTVLEKSNLPRIMKMKKKTINVHPRQHQKAIRPYTPWRSMRNRWLNRNPTIFYVWHHPVTIMTETPCSRRTYVLSRAITFFNGAMPSAIIRPVHSISSAAATKRKSCTITSDNHRLDYPLILLQTGIWVVSKGPHWHLHKMNVFSFLFFYTTARYRVARER